MENIGGTRSRCVSRVLVDLEKRRVPIFHMPPYLCTRLDVKYDEYEMLNTPYASEEDYSTLELVTQRKLNENRPSWLRFPITPSSFSRAFGHGRFRIVSPRSDFDCKCVQQHCHCPSTRGTLRMSIPFSAVALTLPSYSRAVVASSVIVRRNRQLRVFECFLHTRHRQEEAVATYALGLQVEPKNADMFNNMSNALKHLPGRLEAAIQALNQAIKLRPNFAAALGNLGNIYLEQGDDQAAITYYCRAIEADRGFADAYRSRKAIVHVPP